MAITAAQGPSRIAISVAPTAWPVEPPTTGTLNIMMTNENAAASASSGICRVRRVRFTLRAAITQMGSMTSHRTTKVCGPRYPSGMCIATGVIVARASSGGASSRSAPPSGRSPLRQSRHRPNAVTWMWPTLKSWRPSSSWTGASSASPKCPTAPQRVQTKW